MNTYIKDRREEGFTLIELLIAIVVVGILTAVVIVGIGGLQNTGSKGACAASRDAAKAASTVYKANHLMYPTDFTSMLNDTPNPDLELSDATQASATRLAGSGWTLDISGGGATAPGLLCTP